MLRRTFLYAAAKPNSLAAVYGHELTQVVYIQAFALIGQLRLGNLAEVERLVAPHIENSLDNLTPSHLSGHLLFAELYARTKKQIYQDRVLAAANRAELSLYNEMSDGVFMGCPILGKAGHFDRAVDQIKGMQKLCLRSDGLYRHSPLCEAAWGRGNAFPALGMAIYLESDPNNQTFRQSFSGLCETLLKWQSPGGLWRQVIDHPTAYEEFSATAMIGAALRKGIRNGWLPRKPYKQAVQRAQKAIASRTSLTGELIDVCESTGKQKTLADYLNRKAIRGRDPRGGAMALYFATEP